MKQASRFMPSYEPGKLNKCAQMAFFVILMIMIFYEPWLILVIVGIASFILIFCLMDQSKVERHFIKLCNERDELSICEFAREFDPRAVATWVIRAVYEQLQDAFSTKLNVPIKASDGLFDTLMLDEDDLDFDLVEEISQRTGRTLDDYENNPYYPKVTTVRNLVLFFNHQTHANATI